MPIVERIGPDRGASTLFVHGSPSDARVWHAVTAKVPSGTRLALLDLPDHDVAVDESTARYAPLLDDVSVAIDSLGPSPVTLVGRSLGAFLALEVVRRAAGRVAHLVLIGGFCSIPDDAIDMRLGLANQFEGGQFSLEALRGAMFDLMLDPAPRDRSVEAIVSTAMVDIGKLRLPRSIRRSNDLRGVALPPTDVPVTVVRGERNAAIPLAAGQQVARSAPEQRLSCRRVARTSCNSRIRS